MDIISTHLHCPFCEKELSIEEVLSNSSCAWVNQNWIYFTCQCQKHSHIQIYSGNISIGELNGAPGPYFIPYDETSAMGLVVSKTRTTLTCTYANKEYTFKQK